jgi:hypothetical protein
MDHTPTTATTPVADGDIGVAVPEAIRVIDYSISTNYTRSTANFFLDVELAAS